MSTIRSRWNPTIPDHIAIRVGRFMAATSMLDFAMDSVIWHLLRLDPADARPLTFRLESNRKVDTIDGLISRRELDCESDASSVGPDRGVRGTALSSIQFPRFLGGDLKEASLQEVAEYAVNEVGLNAFQLYIRELFLPFQPADFHTLIARFRWHAIATTNFDLIVERSYAMADHPRGQLVPFYKNGQTFEHEMKSVPDGVPFFKLHGCITHYLDRDIPLILTSEQYIKFSNNRTRLFDIFRSLGHELPLVFCGYSISDSHIQNILFDLFNDGIVRPMFFVVRPNINPIQARYWSSKRITPVNLSFAQFLEALEEEIPEESSALPASWGGGSASIRKHYRRAGIQETSHVMSFLEVDADHVRADIPTEGQKPSEFYRGNDVGWAGIARNLDVRRRVADTIMLDAILTDEGDRPKRVDLHVLKGPAGNGKTVTMKRLAWDAAIEFDKIVLFMRPAGAVRPDAISEIYSYCQDRIFLFIDRAAFYVSDIRELIRTAMQSDMRLTIFTAERDNEWNVRCSDLDPDVEQEYAIRYLSETEIGSLLVKLEQHNALGLLEDEPYEQRVVAFLERAQRQLLVALHEATLGRRFEEIMIDEYNRILPLEAQQLYLDVCTLNRLGVGVRAGLLSRASGVRFTDFRDRFLLPLQHVVHAYFDRYADDMIYVARHSHIAEIVFSNVIGHPEKRFDQVLYLLSAMNVDYYSDMEAFRQLVQWRRVIDSFSSADLGRRFYDAAEEHAGDQAFVYQQRGTFEMHHSEGDLNVAETAIARALSLAPHDRAVLHSSAALARMQAQRSVNPLLREKYRRTAKERLSGLVTARAQAPHGFHTMALLYMDELREIVAQEEGERTEASDRAIVSLCQEIEGILDRGLQKFPTEAMLLTLQAEYFRFVDEEARAWQSLRRAFERNKRLDWVAELLARRLTDRGDIEEAKSVLRACLDNNPESKLAHRALARLYGIAGTSEERKRIIQHLSRSFTEGDSNYDSQFWYARELFLQGHSQAAHERFEKLKTAPISPEARNKIRGIVRNEGGRPKVFHGTIATKREAYLFVSCDELGTDIYGHVSQARDEVWSKIRERDRIQFELGFNMRGPAATAIVPGGI